MSDSFDDALVEAIATEDSNRVVRLCDTGQPITTRALFAGIATGRLGIVEVLVVNGANVAAVDERGIAALHVAAAAGSPLLSRYVATPLDVDFAAIVDAPERAHVAAIVALLCERGADVNARAGASGVTPLGLARFFGQRAVAELLLARGANPGLRDALGRIPEQLAVFPAIGRVIRMCRRLPMVRAAYVTQIYAPATHQFTSPALALELAGPLPADAFAGWPEDAALVVFGLGEDAISRLVRLAPPVYVAPGPASGRAIATSIAGAIDATVRDVPSRDHTHQFAIVLPDGRVPVLVRDFGHALGVTVGDNRSWSMLATADTATIISDVAATARHWAGSHPETATLLDIALELVDALGAETGERWTIGIPGTPEPSELWLHGAQHDAAAVGVFASAAKVEVDGTTRSTSIATRAELRAARLQVVANVRAQLAAYARNVALGDQVRALATELCTRLATRFPDRPWATTVRGFASHARAISVQIDSQETEAAVVSAGVDAEHVHAGLRGAAGWDGDVRALDAVFDAIAAAIARAFTALTVDKLVPGMRLRVIANLGELVAGSTVRYVGIDDLDNHWGRYVFAADDGTELAVSGDLVASDGGPLAEIHRFLERA